MADCKINFTEETDPLAYGLYQDFSKIGVSCSDFDYGYNVTNYAGLYCPDKDARSCIKGKGDGVVEADEVKEYALDKEYEMDPQKYEQYRKITEGRLGEPLPWVLDDLDPTTTFDAKVRKRVQAAIDELKRVINEKGIEDGSDKYKEMLAAGLTWFVATPPVDKATGKVAKDRFTQRTIDGIKKDGLEGFWEYLEKNGGIWVGGDNSKEYTALEALRKRKGVCTEISKILFAAMKMAGLWPIFIDEDLPKEETNDPLIKEAVESAPSDFHTCIGLYTGERIRFFDSMLINSNADYRLYIPLSLRQYLSFDYSNRGGAWKSKGKLDKAIADYTRAIALDPKSASAYYNRGLAWKNKGELDKAIADYTKAMEINPKFVPAYNNRCVDLRDKGELDMAIADCTRAIELDPKLALVYYNRGLAWKNKGDFDKAIADIAKAAALDRALYYNDLLTVTKEKWQSAEGLKNSASLFRDEMGRADISAYEAQLAIAYALWEFKKHEEARKTFNGILTYLSFKAKTSKSTTDFFNDMLRKMTAPMKKDKGVQDSLRSLREKMK